MEVLLILTLIVGVSAIVLLILLLTKKAPQPDTSGLETAQKTLIETLSLQHNQQMEKLEREYQTQITRLEERLEQQAEQARKLASLEFSKLSGTILAESSDALKSANRNQMEAILEPLKVKLDMFGREFRSVSESTNNTQHRLEGQIESLLKANKMIEAEAEKLARALKGNSKVQGDWGEHILQTLLEHAGMVEGVNFSLQQTTDEGGNKLCGSDGKGKRPDAVILLPGNRSLIIDSKVSLSSYSEWMNCEDEAQRKGFAAKHARSVKSHIDEIAKANYPEVIDSALDFVLMFMPLEGAYFAVFEENNDIWKYAYENRVMIVSPTHLFGVIQLISALWRQDSIDKNAKEISRLSGELYDKFIDFVEKLTKTGDFIEKAQKSYKSAYNAMTYGKNSMVKRAENLRTLGAETQKRIPSKLLEESDGEPVED